jgi:DNA-binding CsgD family transcriptional regulator
MRLLDRERELALLDRLLAQAAAGTAAVGLVEGAPGIGKTMLMQEARQRAGELGMRVLAARAGELEREFPFGVVRQLFETELAHEEDRERALGGAASSARAVFGLAGPEPEAADPSFASLHGLYWLTINLGAAGPLLIAVDDLHWCDRPSLRFLAYLARRLEGLAVLMLCGLRSSEPGVDQLSLGEIAADPLAVTVRPGPLSSDAVTDLVRERLDHEPTPAFAAACRASTGGNPLLLGELLRELAAEAVDPDDANLGRITQLGPRAISRAVLVRLARLPAEAGAIARAVAILGDGAEVSIAASLAQLSDEEAAHGTGALVRAEILSAETPLGFVHPVVGAAVHRDIPPGERELQHAHAAKLLADTEAPVEQIAAQLLASPAGNGNWAVETLSKAASSALKQGAADNAAAYLDRALAEPLTPQQRTEVVLELGRAEALTNGAAAVAHLREAHEAASDPVERGRIGRLLARALLFSGHPDEGAAIARHAALEVPAEVEDLRLELEAIEMIAVCVFGAGNRADLCQLERWRTLPDHASLGAKMLAAVAAQDWANRGGSSEQCAGLALQALAGDDLIAADTGLLSISAIFVLVIADRHEALHAWDHALAHAHLRGSLFSMASIQLWRGFTMYWRGELKEAQETLQSASTEFETRGYGPQQAQIYCDSILAAVLRERGELAQARLVLERSSDTGDDSDGNRYWLTSSLELMLAEGRFAEVPAAADDVAQRFDHIRNPADAPWRSSKSVALYQLGRHDEALVLAAQELELARVWGAPGTVARALCALGTLEQSSGLGRLREAVEVVEGSPARLEHAKALAALGAALRRARRPAHAREPLRHALELADSCGADGLAESTRTELYATGARPRTTALSGVQSLTASERRVAALAIEGNTNREIAQALFITPKTVELHLSSAYRKLGIRSRRELPTELTGTPG